MSENKVVVFGGGGYVGATLIPLLLNQNYKVKVFDTFWYGEKVFEKYKSHINLEIIKGDIRDIQAVSSALRNANTVIHLACISNDPSFDLDPKLGKSINLDSFLPLVRAAKNLGIEHFIYASSSSVYGIKNEDKVTEELSLEPLTDYSRFKMLCEKIVLEEQSVDFVCTVLRPATVCGVSPRQRFDLAVNILTNNAINLNKIEVYGGSQSRPNLNIKDMARAYLHVMQHKDKVAGEIFNIGGENLTLNQIAEKVRLQLGKNIEILLCSTDDLRSYRVDSEKIFKKIGFKPMYSIDDAINDLKTAFLKGEFVNSLENSLYFNIKRMKELNLF